MADEAKHVRGDKIPTYLAALGGLNAAVWGLAFTVTFPVLTFVGAVGVVAGAALSDNVRDKLKKVGDQMKDWGRDLKSHISEDISRVTNWWSNRRERKNAEKAASIEQASAAFRNSSVKGPFNDNAPAAPAVGLSPDAQKAAPPVIVEVPKAPAA